MPDKIINHVVIDGQPGKFYAPNVLTGLEETDEITELKSGLSDLKENLSGLETDGVAPSAEQLLSKNMTADAVPYHFRQTGGDGADREYVDAIVGGTVNWNQRVRNGNFESTTDWSVAANVTSFTVADNIATLETAAATDNIYLDQYYHDFVNGHKYLICAELKVNSLDGNPYFNFATYPSVSGIFVATSSTTTNWEHFTAIKAANESATSRIRVGARCGVATAMTYQMRNAQVFDLTAMFGTTIADYIYSLEQTTAGAGLAFFKSLFPNAYYPYNAGELVSVSGLSEHKMVGFNQWDEEWEVGGIKTTDGTLINLNDVIRSKNFNPIIGGASYYLKSTTGSAGTIYIFFYDENKDYIGYDSKNNSAVTAPSNAKFFKIQPSSAYGGVYNHDICINLSDPTRNGTYEPYEAHSYPLDSDVTLRGIPKLDANNNLYYDGDEYEADGTVTRRYGIVDLGTLNWSATSGYQGIFQTLYGDAVNVANNVIANAICTKYTTVKGDDVASADKAIAVGMNSAHHIFVHDSSYASATDLKTAMSGVMLVYELATPTTEEATPYQHLQQCDPNGTEEYVSTGIVPVGHNTQYPENLKAKIEGLPWNFANLIAPTEATFTATRNYTTGALFIVDNVLYKATSNIANGGTITPNTNCTATTLAEIISALA